MKQNLTWFVSWLDFVVVSYVAVRLLNLFLTYSIEVFIFFLNLSITISLCFYIVLLIWLLEQMCETFFYLVELLVELAVKLNEYC